VLAYENNIKKRLAKTDAKKANDYFNNDSFWLIAPLKLQTLELRSIVMQDNEEALMVTLLLMEATPEILMCG
jgi:hypothetical protein